jgi:GxxExxY protein
MELLYKQECYQIIGACMEVHSQLGNGFLETVYQEALAIELTARNIPFVKEQKLEISYKEQKLDKYYIADFVCYGKIILETKAIKEFVTQNEAQILNYLKATGYKLGLLVNFGQASLLYKRIISEYYFNKD